MTEFIYSNHEKTFLDDVATKIVKARGDKGLQVFETSIKDFFKETAARIMFFKSAGLLHEYISIHKKQDQRSCNWLIFCPGLDQENLDFNQVDLKKLTLYSPETFGQPRLVTINKFSRKSM